MTTGDSPGADPADQLSARIYRVGGAVRDRHLGLPVRERDWVVVGTTPEAMEAAGFQPVGKDFPVFIHPRTGEEYALARTERKSGPGHTGFTFHATPDVTLEADLERRDLTINAMAETPEGELIDPYGGARDLAERRLRHVSPAFEEDPLRVLRVARFAAYLAPCDFEVADETLTLMSRMAARGDLDELTPERVWKELEKALATQRPDAFFSVLHQCGALAAALPELVPAAQADCPVLRASISRTEDIHLRFGAVVLDAARRGPINLAQLGGRLRAPKRALTAARLAVEHTHTVRAAMNADATELMALLEALDALRRPERLSMALVLAESQAEAEGTSGAADLRGYLESVLAAAQSVDTAALAREAGGGPAAGAAIRQARIDAIQRVRESSHAPHGNLQ